MDEICPHAALGMFRRRAAAAHSILSEHRYSCTSRSHSENSGGADCVSKDEVANW